MVSSDIIAIILSVVTVVPLAIVLYAGYWAFDIRHALVVRVYRNQALGVGLLSVFLIYLTFIAALGPPGGPYGAVIGFLELMFGVIGFLGLLYFVDSSMLASRRSDPLLRDTLHWSKVRYVIWGYEIFAAFFAVVDAGLSLIHGVPSSLMQFMNFGFSFSFPFVFLVPVFSFLVLFPAWLRAKDRQLRQHFKWLGLMAVAVIIFDFAFPSGGPFATTAGTALAIVLTSFIGYCLYKSARSLVPLNRISAFRETSNAGPSLP